MIVNTYYRKITKFIPKLINIKPEAKFLQNAGNCWIYWVFENLYLNTWILINPEEAKAYIKTFWFEPDSMIGNDSKYSWPIICDFLKTKWYDMMFYEIDVMKQTKLFAELLKKRYWFCYVRDCHDSVLQDIADDKEIDNIITSKWYRHNTNVWFLNNQLMEFGTWGDDNIYNNFVYKTTDIFIKSIRAWAIQWYVRFLDFKQ